MERKIKVEVCPPGVCEGAIETIVDKNVKGWGGMSAVGFGAQLRRKDAPRKKGKLYLDVRKK